MMLALRSNGLCALEFLRDRDTATHMFNTAKLSAGHAHHEVAIKLLQMSMKKWPLRNVRV